MMTNSLRPFFFACLLALLSFTAKGQVCNTGITFQSLYAQGCRYGTTEIRATNIVPGATYNWTISSGLTVLSRNGPWVRLYLPNAGNFPITLQQICPNGGASTVSGSFYVSSGTNHSPTNYTAYGPDTVIANVDTTFYFYWNFVSLGPGTNSGTILKYLSPNDKYGVGLGLVFGSGGGYRTDSMLIHWNADYSIGKYGISVNPVNYCGDTVYNTTFIVGGISGPKSACQGDIVTYNLPAGTVNSWTVVGGTILSGQGTNTVQVQWNTTGNDSIYCNWNYGTYANRTTSRQIIVGSSAPPVISGPSSLCNLNNFFSVASQPGHHYYWTVNGAPAGTNSSIFLSAGNQPMYTIAVYDTIGSCVTTANLVVSNPVYPHPVITTNTYACASSAIPFSVAAIPGATYNWNVGTGTILTGAGTNAITVSFPSTGYVFPSVTVTLGGCARVARDTVQLYDAPRPDLGPNQIGCPNVPLTIFNNNVGSFSTSYLTPFGPIFGGYSMTVPGPGTYWMRATENFGPFSCSATDTIVITAGPSLAANLGPNVTVCNNPSLVLSPTVTGAAGPYTYAWSNGMTTPTITVSSSGNYSVAVSKSGFCVGRDTIQVTFSSVPAVTLPPNVILCPGASTVLNAGLAYTSYLWSTGATTSSISTSTPGSYTVTVTDNIGCQSNATTVITNGTALTANLGPDLTVCNSPSQVLSPTVTGAAAPFTYAWSNGMTTPTITVSSPGSYAVTVSKSGYCVGIDTVIVAFSTVPLVSLPANVNTCPGASTLLDAGLAYSSYLWNTGATSSSISPNAPGSYTVTVTDNLGCQSNATTVITNYPAPSLILGADTAICPDTFAIFQSAPFLAYAWSNGSSAQAIQVSLPNTYSVTVTDNNACTWSDNVLLSLNTDCIWPGDADHDGTANNADILAIGYAMAGTGPARTVQNTSWYGQTATNWSQTFPSLLNYKHADCDGNGLVDYPDTNVVILNYGLLHNKFTGATTGPELRFVPLQPSWTVGDTLAIDIYLGDVSNQVVNVNGIAYSVLLNGMTASLGDVWFTFPASILGSIGNDQIALALEEIAPGRHDLAQSRIGANPISGYGAIARMFIRTDSLLLPQNQNQLNLSFGDILMLDGQLQPILVAGVDASVNVDAPIAIGTNPSLDAHILIFPNPVHDLLHLERQFVQTDTWVTISDLRGKVLSRTIWESNQLELPVDMLSDGTYILSVQQAGKTLKHAKVTVMH